MSKSLRIVFLNSWSLGKNVRQKRELSIFCETAYAAVHIPDTYKDQGPAELQNETPQQTLPSPLRSQGWEHA